MRNRDNRRGNVATLLIENSSALAILIKSWKSLARSIVQTGEGPIGRLALWQWPFAMRARCDSYVSTTFRLFSFCYFYIRIQRCEKARLDYLTSESGKLFASSYQIFSTNSKIVRWVFELFVIYNNFCNKQ